MTTDGDDAFELAPEGAEYVINHYRSTNQNLRTQLNRIIERAGLEPWPKLFHNLRACRETELATEHPLHVVCYWIGNSATIAQKHYLQVTDEHLEKAAQGGAKSGALSTKTPAQNAGHSAAASAPKKSKNPVKTGVLVML
jgi:hypothetical protein